jgi:hypothetical protein
MERWVRAQGRELETLYFYYTTCPPCAKRYGKNYVVAIAKVKDVVSIDNDRKRGNGASISIT